MNVNKMLADMADCPPVSARFSRTCGTCAAQTAQAQRCSREAACGRAADEQTCCQRGAEEGVCHCPAVIAMAYTPMQREDSCMFEPEHALKRGTLFAGLDLPLWNDFRSGCLPLSKLTDVQALKFAAHELALYLDTHPCDEEAIRLYNAYRTAANERSAEFCRTEYPLTQSCNTENTCRYAWVDDPWPWQTGKEKK